LADFPRNLNFECNLPSDIFGAVVEHRGHPTKFLHVMENMAVLQLVVWYCDAGHCCGFTAHELVRSLVLGMGQRSLLLLSKALRWTLKYCLDYWMNGGDAAL